MSGRTRNMAADAAHLAGLGAAPVGLTLSLPRPGRHVLGSDLNCSEIDALAGPMCLQPNQDSTWRAARRCTTTPLSTLGVHVRRARSNFSNALNFRRSAIAG